MVVRKLVPEPRDGRVIVPITVDDYHALLAQGRFKDGDPIELIDGMLVRKDRSRSAKGPTLHHPDHATAVKKLRILDRLVESHGCHAQFQLPVTIPEYDEPEPDAAIVKGGISDYGKRIPDRGTFSPSSKPRTALWASIARRSNASTPRRRFRFTGSST